MNYDKASFLSGLAVGRQLRGWATAEGGGAGDGRFRAGLTAARPVSFAADFALAGADTAWNGAIAAGAWISTRETAVALTLAVPGGAPGGAIGAELSLAT